MRTEASLANQRVAALIPAAGRGVRMGGAVTKPFLRLGDREILTRTLEVFENCTLIEEIWLIVGAEHCTWCQQAIVERYGFQKVRGVVVGGATRQESVWRGLLRVQPPIEIVVVHDGVRPLVTETLVAATVHSAMCNGAAIAAVPLKDTLKRVSASGEVEATVSREHLWRIQTPQVFRRHLLYEAFQHAWEHELWATDEAGLVEAFGHPVHVVLGLESNVKITTPDDLIFCERFTRGQV
jgi:2-C-methyl-D-erythritol 4-phosphate cytidylyltransferase